MSEIILTNKSDSYIFTKMDSQLMQDVKDTYPNLRKVFFKDVVIEDFSVLEMFSGCSGLYFDNCVIKDIVRPIRLEGSTIEFLNTRVDFQRFFFMVDMPNLKDIHFYYDSVEGVNMYAKSMHLLAFYPTIERIRVVYTPLFNVVTYYDMDHTMVLDSEWGDNETAIWHSDIEKYLDFIYFMPNYKFKTGDGIIQHLDRDDMMDMHWIVKMFWVNPRMILHYENMKYDDLKKVKRVLVQASKLSKDYKARLGKEFLEFPDIDPLTTWPNLSNIVTNRLRYSRLGSIYSKENDEPLESSIYGLFGQKLYDTKGHAVIVNSRGSMLVDKSIDSETGEVENHLLPF